MAPKPKTLAELQQIVPPSAGELRQIPGVTNVVASSDGRLWTVARGKPARIIEQGLTQRYVRVKRENGKFTYIPVAALIARAFLGEPSPDNPTILFRDGDYTNCRSENLQYGSREEHFEQMTPYQNRGEEHGMAKLTEMDIVAIRYLYQNDYSPQEIAQRFEITDKNVLAIVKRKTWRHVP